MKRIDKMVDLKDGLKVEKAKPIRNMNDIPIDSLLTSSEVGIKKRD